MKRLLLVGSLLAGALSLDVLAQSTGEVIEAAARAMGATSLQSIQYSGAGSSFTVGQAPGPGAPWPRFQVAKYVVSVNYSAPAMREELVRRDVEYPPRGGGAGPFIPATGQGGMRPIPGDVIQNVVRDARTEAGLIQIWMTPHGFLKGATANKASTATARVQGRTVHTVSFAVGKHTVTGTINDQHLVERVETRLANNVLGDVLVQMIFSDYRDYAGVKFPTRILQLQAGHSTLDVTIADVQPNSAAALAVTGGTQREPAPPAQPLRTGSERIADGVWFLTGGAPMSVLVEFSDHVVIIEAPQGDERVQATIAEVKRLMPAKPVRFFVNTHHHFDHAGGIRGVVAEGIPIITHEKNKPYFERILANPFQLEPDRLARSGRKAVIETVGDKRVLGDGSMTLELYHVRGNLHDEALLMAYLPKQKLLVQSDVFHPRPGAAPLASPPPFTVNFLENIRRLKLDVARVVQVHGGVEPFTAVVRAAGQ